MRLEEYFEQPSTPAKNSPTGLLMVKIVGKFPGISFDDARKKAYELLDKAAGKRKYAIPPVLSEAELERSKAGMRARLQKRELAKAA